MDPSISAYGSLGADINKQTTDGTEETRTGIISDKLPELTLDMPDEDIVKLTTKWESSWSGSAKKKEWEKLCEDAENYWLGKQFEKTKADTSRPMVDNLIFESVETYLPQVTRRNPEPLVTVHSSEKGEDGMIDPIHTKFVEKVKTRLTDIADEGKLRLKLKKVTRHWAIYLMGVAKFGWDLDRDMPTVRIIRPKKIILDPDAVIDEDGYHGNRVGEYRKMEASKVLAIIGDADDKTSQNARAYIKKKLEKDEMGTELQFIEWWTPEYVCWRMDKEIIFKRKNPHWNYDETVNETEVDEYGNESEVENEKVGVNHLPVPDMPYRFLVVFSLGNQPMDNTSLITQNIANQDLINKRNKQIDRNADKMNGGAVVSLERSGLTDSQAKNVVKAVRDGGTVMIPSGAPQDAVYFPQVPSLPSDVFKQLADTRNRLRDIFGTTGSTPAGIQNEDTVRGKIITRGLDTDRIGGGASEYLEQFADDIYNWIVQLLYVYDDQFQFVAGAKPPRIVISVKEGSLLPKDSIAIANQALELAGMGKISNIDLYKRLEYPNPEEMAANVWLEANAPQVLFRDNPMVQEVIQAQQQQAQMAAQQETQQKEQETQTSHARDIQKEVLRSRLKSVDSQREGMV